jgi:elongation factor 1-alpha
VFVKTSANKGRVTRGQVLSIQMHHTPLSVAQCGDVVGVHLKGNVDKCKRGDIVSDTRSGKAVATTSFTAHICIVHHPTKIQVGSVAMPRSAAPLTSRRPHAACISNSYTPVVAAHTTHVPCRVVELLSLLDKASGQVVAKVQCDVSLSLRVCRCWLRGVSRVLLCCADERCSSLPV